MKIENRLQDIKSPRGSYLNLFPKWFSQVCSYFIATLYCNCRPRCIVDIIFCYYSHVLFYKIVTKTQYRNNRGDFLRSSRNYEARNRRPTTASSAVRKTTTDDWLGLRPNSSSETAPSHYEPSSSSSRGPSRRQDFRRQSTQQRTSRSAGLLFSDDDEDDDGNRNAAAEKKPAGGARHGFDDLFADPTPIPVGGGTADPVAADRQTLSKRRETSPSIATAARTNNAAGGMNCSRYIIFIRTRRNSSSTSIQCMVEERRWGEAI